jgi:hypothetical protein
VGETAEILQEHLAVVVGPSVRSEYVGASVAEQRSGFAICAREAK